MASVKVKFRASQVKGKEGAIYYQVIHERVIRQVKTQYKILEEEWDETTSDIGIPKGENVRIEHVNTIRGHVMTDMNRFVQIIKSLDCSSGFYSVDDVVIMFKKQLKGITFFNFMQSVIVRLIELHKYRTSETYRTTLNSFMRFRRGVDFLLVDISSDMMMDYEAYLKSERVTNNTISFYMRILRAVYNRAVDQELIEQRFPFKKVYTGVEKTVKRALSLKYIKCIKNLDLATKPKLAFARDMFLFSFYMRGMSFVDMAYLRANDLKNGVVNYRRRKTGQQLCIKWERCMQEILERYDMSNTGYLLPIIRDIRRDDRDQYRNMLCYINTKLKQIGELIGLTTPLTLYVARHSWASIAKSRNIPISVISEGMGHDSETTTQIYLASLDNSVVDKANSLILKLL